MSSGLIERPLRVAQGILQVDRRLPSTARRHRLTLRVVDSGKLSDRAISTARPRVADRGPAIRTCCSSICSRRCRLGRAVSGRSSEISAHAPRSRATDPGSVWSAPGLDALREQHGVDCLGREVRGSRVVARLTDSTVVEAGLHQDRHMMAMRNLRSALQTSKRSSRHDHVEHHAVHGMLAESLQRRAPSPP